jgi:hypothetical protein
MLKFEIGLAIVKWDDWHAIFELERIAISSLYKKNKVHYLRVTSVKVDGQ